MGIQTFNIHLNNPEKLKQYKQTTKTEVNNLLKMPVQCKRNPTSG